MDRIPLDFNKQSERSFEEYMGQGPTVDSSDATSAAFEMAVQDTPVMLLARRGSVKELEGRSGKISAEEANSRYPGLPDAFTEPVSPYVAQLKYDQFEKQQELQRKIQQGPQDAWTKSKQFGAGLLAHLMDPIEFGAGAALGWGAGAVIARGALGTRVAVAAKAAQAGTASTAARVGVSAAENFAGNLVQNVGQEIQQAETLSVEGRFDTRTNSEIMTDVMMNTFAATAVGGIIKEGALLAKEGKVFGRGLEGVKRFLRNTSPEADLAIARHTIAAAETDIRPDFEPMLKTLAQETSVNPKEFGQTPYHFERGLEGKKLYVATREATGDLAGGTKIPLGDDFGMGVHASDNPGVANAAASRSMSDNIGGVHEIEVGQLNPLDLDTVVRPEVRDLFEAQLKSLGEDTRMLDTSSTKEIMQMIRDGVDSGLLDEAALSELADGIKERGFNALTSDGKTHLGYEHSQHNHVTILDENLIKGKEAFEASNGMTKGPDSDLLTKLANRSEDFRNHTLVDGDMYDFTLKELEEIRAESGVTPDSKAQIEELMNDLSEIEKQGHFTPDEVKALDNLRDANIFLEIKNTLVKAATVCARA